jgi:hypothetical protein
MVVLYGSPATNRIIVAPGTARALPIDGRVFVQEPNVGHLFAGDSDRAYRLSGLHVEQLLAAGTGPAMASMLRRRIDEHDCPFPPYGNAGCRSGLVFVDEIDYRFAEKAPNLNTPAWRGRTSRAQPKPKFPNYVPQPRPGQPGYELSVAMGILAATPYPSGGTYASRVHFYIAPGVVSSIGVGRGAYRNLGRDRRPHFRSHEGVRAALQLAGGVWLEMYHFHRRSGTRTPFSTREWMDYPARFAKHLTGPGSRVADPVLAGKVRFLMTRGAPPYVRGAPAVCRSPRRPQRCQFALAQLPQNAPMLANGVGQYRMEGNEREWRGQVHRLFFRP